jgi:hypothetical protein
MKSGVLMEKCDGCGEMFPANIATRGALSINGEMLVERFHNEDCALAWAERRGF